MVVSSFPNDWLERLAMLDNAEKTWHKLTLPDGVTAVQVKGLLEDRNIGRYIWKTDDLVNDRYWNDPIKQWSDARHVLFEDENDIVMFMLKL